LILFMAALISLIQPLRKLSRIYGIHQQALAAAKRLTEVFETKTGIEERPDAPDMGTFSREIKFENVWFRYPAAGRMQDRPKKSSQPEVDPAQEPDVLKGVDLTVRAGEVIALVGSSGSGKTTLMNLLPRFYDATQGKILIDGIDVKEVSLTSLRDQMALVTQDPFLFHDSVRSNIAFGRPEAPIEQVEAAAQVANAHEFIKAMPQGYDTIIGERGVTLSNGQRQRISIARAAIRKAPIVILDEPTAALDPATTTSLRNLLVSLKKAGMTIIITTHDIPFASSIYDYVYQLDNGVLTKERLSKTNLHSMPLDTA